MPEMYDGGGFGGAGIHVSKGMFEAGDDEFGFGGAAPAGGAGPRGMTDMGGMGMQSIAGMGGGMGMGGGVLGLLDGGNGGQALPALDRDFRGPPPREQEWGGGEREREREREREYRADVRGDFRGGDFREEHTRGGYHEPAGHRGGERERERDQRGPPPPLREVELPPPLDRSRDLREQLRSAAAARGGYGGVGRLHERERRPVDARERDRDRCALAASCVAIASAVATAIAMMRRDGYCCGPCA